MLYKLARQYAIQHWGGLPNRNRVYTRYGPYLRYVPCSCVDPVLTRRLGCRQTAAFEGPNAELSELERSRSREIEPRRFDSMKGLRGLSSLRGCSPWSAPRA